MFGNKETYSNTSANAHYYVSGSTAFALGHYPEDPIFPGVMSLNLMQSLAEGLAKHLTGETRLARGIKRISYIAPVRPGSVMHVACDAPISSSDCQETIIKSRVTVGDQLVAKSEFLFDLIQGDA